MSGTAVMAVPEVAGVLSGADVAATAATIAQVQAPSGMIPWFPGGHADPWNHVEAAMALLTAGYRREAERAYQWLCDMQRPDGAWHNYYLVGSAPTGHTVTGRAGGSGGSGGPRAATVVEDPKLDANCVAYLATGVWHHWLATGDRGFLECMFPVVDRAMEFVLDLQTRRGEVLWARRADGWPWSYALLTGSSSISHSLGRALGLAEVVGQDRPRWADARRRLRATIVDHPEAFEPKDRWAMDWYYPVLAGAVTGPAAQARLAARRTTFVLEGRGVRCVADQPWVTAAETCECAMAFLAAGQAEDALDLFTWAQAHRTDDGDYLTGLVYPDRVQFPADERSSYTAAAVVLAADALYGANPTSALFTDLGPS